MRRLVFAVLCLCLAACDSADLPDAPKGAQVEFVQPPLRAASPLPQAPEVCLEDARAALEKRLEVDGRWAIDPIVGPMSPRGLKYGIDTHSYDSLQKGLVRYRSLEAGVETYKDTRTAVLIAYAGERESCAWLVSAEGIAAYGRTAIGIDQVRADVASVVAALEVDKARAARSPRRRKVSTLSPSGAPPLPDVRPGDLATALAHVAESVLPSAVADALSGFDALIIAPHQGIVGFPFMLLPQRRASGPSTYLVDRMSIQIAPSLSEVGMGRGLHRDRNAALATMSAHERRAALATALVVGDPAFADAEYDMPRLPGARSEAESVAQRLGTTPLTGATATLAAVRERLAAQSRPIYLHFATHGLADTEDVADNRSFIALAAGDRFTAQDARALGVADGSVVVLSACQTGLGAVRAGGVIGLPRAFQLAGAQTVVMSLWNVDDAATNLLMIRFAEHLEQSGRPASAFAEAVRDTRKQFPDPRYWASFEVFGVGQP